MEDNTITDAGRLDLMMPDIDGFETLHSLRSVPATKEIPVVMITARGEKELEQEVIKAGGNDLLRKPVDMRALADVIAVHTDPL